MTEIRKKIYEIIEETKLRSVPVNDCSNLYTDLGYDSLGFVSLLLTIEKDFSIEFELMEMESCLQVGKLVALAEDKMRRMYA